MSGAGWRGLVVSLVAITTVTAPPLDGGGLGRVLDVCFLWPRRCDMMVVCLIASARSRVLVATYSFRSKRIAGALIRAHRRGVNVKVALDAL